MLEGAGTGPGVPARLTRAALVALIGFGLVTPSLCAQPPRTFFLVLDAIPYSAVAALQSAGKAPELFDELGSPVPLISSFPSTTTVALADALGPLGLDLSPGYEARFFDWQEEKVRGGGAISYFRIEFPWRSFFQWSKKSVARSAFASLRPVGASEGRVIAALKAFLSSDLRDFFAYIETTDTAAHLKGPSSLDAMFTDLGRAIREARAAGEDFRVVVFSDHGIDGGEPLNNVLPGIRGALRSAGLRRVKRLVAADDVVLTPYGLVSSFEAYARGEQAPRLARLLASVEGVEICTYRFEEDVWVASAGGLARIARRGEGATERWAYLPVEGDPLRYEEVVARLQARAGPGSAGDWHPDEGWFRETRGEFFPDALRRIARGFELVRNPATTICSVTEGYMYGARKTERAARITGGRLRWTHGALFWNASAGFLLTDVPGGIESGPIRLSGALRPLLSGDGQSVARARTVTAGAVTVLGSRE
ncbi:MAG: hypothetical protein ACE5GX_13655 [Thermoanaerobaculia bacterium]